MIPQIAAVYGLQPKRHLPTQKGYRNQTHPIELTDGQLVNLIIYKQEPGIVAKIKHANAAADFLASKGFPARKTYSSKIVQLKAGQHTKYASLYYYLPGNTIPWEAYTQNHIKLLGMAMANMHHVLRKLDLPDLPAVADEYHTIFNHMSDYFTRSGVRSALQSKLDLQPPAIDKHKQILKKTGNLPSQILHMDFVRGNVLFVDIGSAPTNRLPLPRHPGPELGSSKNELLIDWIPDQVRNDGNQSRLTPKLQLGHVSLTGILDFEKTSQGHPIFDVARTLAFLLVDSKFKTEAKIRKYFLQSGYIKRGGGQLDTPAMRLLEPLLDVFLLYDFYKFLRHNPYESLPHNQHFVRTRDILLQRKVIEPA
jgi:Ser/Thr protein kinase RdoA (MazF antagonist)